MHRARKSINKKGRRLLKVCIILFNKQHFICIVFYELIFVEAQTLNVCLYKLARHLESIAFKDSVQVFSTAKVTFFSIEAEFYRLF